MAGVQMGTLHEVHTSGLLLAVPWLWGEPTVDTAWLQLQDMLSVRGTNLREEVYTTSRGKPHWR